MSGMSAAHLLAEEGCEVTVIEGRDRIGGRIQSDRSLSIPVDLGASWIHGPKGNPITELADEIGLKRIPTDDSYVMRGKGGRRINEMLAPDLNELEIMTSYGAGSDQMNIREVEARDEKYGDGYDGRDVKFKNGYDQIFKSLTGEYRVLLSEKVQKIAYGSAGVTITSSSDSHDYDAVIVTVPLGVLEKGSIAFNPPLPTQKQKAIQRMGMGLLDKLYLEFEDVFWDKKKTWIYTPENDLPHGTFNVWLNFAKYLDVPIIMAFNGASPALELSKRSDDDLLEMALKTLKEAYAS